MSHNDLRREGRAANDRKARRLLADGGAVGGDDTSRAMSRAMRQIRDVQTAPPYGRPVLGTDEDPVEGPLNITPRPIYYPESHGHEGPSTVTVEKKD